MMKTFVNVMRHQSGPKNCRIEKFTAMTWDGHSVSWVTYPGEGNFVPIGVQSCIGCGMMCEFCQVWRHLQSRATGNMVSFVRPLTAEEILEQVKLSLAQGALAEEKCRQGFQPVVNFTGAGDALVSNLDGFDTAVRRLADERKDVSFILTSVGSVRKLKEYQTRCMDIPRVTHYWSVNFADESLRGEIMPGTKRQSLLDMRALYEEIAWQSGQKVTASFALFDGMNDGQKDVEIIADLLIYHPAFRIKLMAGYPMRMGPKVASIILNRYEALVRGDPLGRVAFNTRNLGPLSYTTTSNRDVIRFMKHLVKYAPSLDVRVREIHGVAEYSGCGNTEDTKSVARGI